MTIYDERKLRIRKEADVAYFKLFSRHSKKNAVVVQ
jgi:hypothetical protein